MAEKDFRVRKGLVVDGTSSATSLAVTTGNVVVSAGTIAVTNGPILSAESGTPNVSQLASGATNAHLKLAPNGDGDLQIDADTIDVTAGSTTLKLKDNVAAALDIATADHSYIKFKTTDSSEQIVFGRGSTFSGTTIANLGTVSAATSITSSAFVGPIDGIVGGNTPAAGSFTTLSSSSTTTVGTNLIVTGEAKGDSGDEQLNLATTQAVTVGGTGVDSKHTSSSADNYGIALQVNDGSNNSQKYAELRVKTNTESGVTNDASSSVIVLRNANYSSTQPNNVVFDWGADTGTAPVGASWAIGTQTGNNDASDKNTFVIGQHVGHSYDNTKNSTTGSHPASFRSAVATFQKPTAVSATKDVLTLHNTMRTTSMGNTGTAIAFSQWYDHSTTPASDAPIIASKIISRTEGNWTETASTRDAAMLFQVVLNNALETKLQLNSDNTVAFKNFTFPGTIGSANQVLRVPSSGTTLEWADQSGALAWDDVSAGDAAIDLTTSSGAITIDSDDSTIGIGTDNVDQAINIGTAGTRTIGIGISDGTDNTNVNIKSKSVGITSSYSSNHPILSIHNQSTGANYGQLILGQTHTTAASSAGDYDGRGIGTIIFDGVDEAGNPGNMAKMIGTLDTAASGDERVSLDFQVRASPNMRSGLKVTAGDDIVNVTLGYGSTSTTTVTGNLVVSGTTTTVSSTVVETAESLFSLASGQTANDTDAVDIGFFGTYDVGGTQKYSGLFRDATDGHFKVFKDITSKPSDGNVVADVSSNYADFYANNLVAAGTITGTISGNQTSLGNIDNGTSNITTGGLLKIDTDSASTGDLQHGAAGTLTMGAGADLAMYHDGTNSHLSNANGDLIITTQGSNAAGIVLNAEDDTVVVKYSDTVGATFATDGLSLASGDTFQVGSEVAYGSKINASATVSDGTALVVGEYEYNNYRTGKFIVTLYDATAHDTHVYEILVTYEGDGSSGASEPADSAAIHHTIYGQISTGAEIGTFSVVKNGSGASGTVQLKFTTDTSGDISLRTSTAMTLLKQ